MRQWLSWVLTHQQNAEDLPKAHTTTGKAVTGDIVGATTAKEAIEGMRPQFEIQGTDETQAAIDCYTTFDGTRP